MLWVNFLHCYQPVNTDAHIIKEATEKSYARIVRALEKNSHIKFTLNINGCLFLRWEELGFQYLIDRIGKLIQKGQIDLTGTACYHPLLPLIPDDEIKRQIKENEEILQKHFGENFKPKGFFMPEMAYSPEVANIIKEFGYEWLILDEIALSGDLTDIDFNKAYLDSRSGIKVVLRNRKLSSSFVPDTIRQKLDDREKIDYPIITATDGELYGLRHIDHTGEFEKLLKRNDFQTLTISEFLSTREIIEEVDLISCSWESTEKELKQHKPYILWSDPDKKIQQSLWNLARLSYETIENYKDDKNYYWARWHMVRGFASCTFWWASEKDFRHIFGPHAWNPDEIERGTNELIRGVRALEDEQTREKKIEAEKLYIDIKKQVWKKHWSYYWKK